jgi:uncharacterized protein YegP (UPF0339 family)
VSVLEFVEHMVSALAWPAVAAGALWAFRKQIMAAIGRIKSAKAFGVEATLTDAGINREIAQAGGALAKEDRDDDDGDDGSRVPGSAPTDTGPEGGPAAAPADTAEEGRRRQDIESLIQGAAVWGWNQARIGAFTSAPLPVVEWTEDGKPIIAFGTTDRSYAVPPSGRYELYREASGGWRFRFKAPNGEIISVSEGYATRQEVLRAIDTMRRGGAPTIDLER